MINLQELIDMGNEKSPKNKLKFKPNISPSHALNTIAHLRMVDCPTMQDRKLIAKPLILQDGTIFQIVTDNSHPVGKDYIGTVITITKKNGEVKILNPQLSDTVVDGKHIPDNDPKKEELLEIALEMGWIIAEETIKNLKGTSFENHPYAKDAQTWLKTTGMFI